MPGIIMAAMGCFCLAMAWITWDGEPIFTTERTSNVIHRY